MSSKKTTPPLRGTPPAEGNDSPSPKGWQAKPDGVVPKLRFPEFWEAWEWEAKLLGAVCEMQAGKFVAASEISERQSEGLYPCFGGNGLRGYTKTFNQSGRYSLIGRQGALCGNVNLAEGNFYATEHAVVTTPKPGNSTDWLFYNLCLLNLNRFATGQAQPGLSIDVLEKVNCATPKDEKEQQKIADCLASLDERITLEAQKLDTLKTHKKGLMQQLFPANHPTPSGHPSNGGEALPKLRFPEFRDGGEWEAKRLEDFAVIVRGGSPRPIDEYITNDPNGLHWLKIGDIDKESKYVTSTQDKVIPAALNKTRVVSPGDLILSNSMSFGRPYILEIKTCIHDGWIAVSEINKSLDRDYLYYLMMTSASQTYFSNNAAGSGVQNLNADIIKLLPVSYPGKKEQQKIADCLASIDDLITAQTQKLTAFKTHKKGLMQQLFPSVGGVAGEA